MIIKTIKVLIIICYSLNICAQDNISTGIKKQNSIISLSNCIKMAHESNPGLLAYRQTLTSLQNKEISSFKEMLPDLYLSFSGAKKINDNNDQYVSSIGVNQTLFAGKSIYTRWKIAEMDTNISKLELIRQYQYITYSVKIAWYDYLKSMQLLKEANDSFERLKKHESNARHFFQEGMIWRTDVLEAELQLARGQQEIIIAENNLALAKVRLNILIHKDVDFEFETNDFLGWIPCNWKYENACEKSFANRTELKEAYIDLEKSKANIVLEKSSYYPNISAQASFSKTAYDIDMRDGYEEKKIQISTSWKIWQWLKTKDNIASAKALVNRNELLIEKIKDQLRLEIKEAWLSVQEADKKVKVMEKALKQGEENFRVNIIRYRERLGTAKDVLDAQDLLTSTRKDYISSLSSYLTSLATLDYAIGIN